MRSFRLKPYAVAVCVVLLLLFIVYLKSSKQPLLKNISFSTAMYDRDMQLLRLTLAEDDTYRLFVPISRVPDKLKEAVLQYEDQYFYSHFGVNPVSLLRAGSGFISKKQRKVGASTITMQLARMLYGIDSSSVDGKVQQIIQALKLELRYSKDEILEAYLNLAPYGHNIEGIGAAGLIYFGRNVEKLTFPEMLVLAVIPQNPVKRTPTNSTGFQTMDEARKRLALQFADADRQLGHLPIDIKSLRKIPFEAPHFVNQLLENRMYWGKSVQTTLDLRLQRAFEKQLQAYVKRNSGLGVENASALLVDWRNMEVLAMVGSNNFYNAKIQGQVNGTAALRSPGSATKPFIYALALDQGLIHPLTMLKDSPKNFGYYSPKNFDKDFMGVVSAQDALIMSRNVPAVDLLQRLNKIDSNVGADLSVRPTTGRTHRFAPTMNATFEQIRPGSFYDILRAVGIKNLQKENFYGLALALGGFEITMQDLAQLYGSLANAGRWEQLKFVETQNLASLLPGIDNKPKKVGKRTLSRDHLQLFSPEAAYLTLDMLKRNVAVDALPQYVKDTERGYDIYWKTGTSYGFRDSWTTGIFGPYILIVWIGNFDGSSNMHFIGRSMAAPLFFELIRSMAVNAGELSRYNQSAGVGLHLTNAKVCSVTGHLPSPSCPKTQEVKLIPGKSPITTCSVHRAIPVNIMTGKRACFYAPNKTVLQTFEFWDSDVLGVFRQAGLSKLLPPPFEENCKLDITKNIGTAPEILYPTAGVVYSLQGGEKVKIPLQAAADSDVQKLYWFVNNKYITDSAPHETVFFDADDLELTRKRHEVKVIDNLGRFAVQELLVGGVR